MYALAIGDDISSDELRRYARGENDGRVRTGGSRSPMRSTGWTGRVPRGWRGGTGKPCAIGFTATTPKASPGCVIDRSLGARQS